MKEPKFKFGEKVINVSSQEVFVIDRISCDHNVSWKYSYSSSSMRRSYGDIWHGEPGLDLYKEPEKKKLYACLAVTNLKDCTGSFQEIRFLKSEKLIPRSWHRVPEYDIDYPEPQTPKVG